MRFSGEVIIGKLDNDLIIKGYDVNECLRQNSTGSVEKNKQEAMQKTYICAKTASANASCR